MKRLTKEHRKRISEANKGQIPWSKGLCLSEKHKMNIKKALNSPEIKKKLSESRKGKGNHFYKKKHTEESKMKMSQSHEGKKNPSASKNMKILWKDPEYRKYMSEINRGEKHANWLGGISFEPYGIEFNEKLKELIRERDNYICQIKECATLQNGRKHPVHHRDYDKRNNKPKNLITLCHPCHSKTNYNRDYWQDYFQRREAML